MKNLSMSLFGGILFGGILIGVYTFTATAEHYGIPTVGQERNERVWTCVTKADAKIFVTAQAEAESFFSWVDMLRDMNRQNRCQMEPIKYVVDEIVETVSGLEVLSREFGEPVIHYIVKTKDNHFVVTY